MRTKEEIENSVNHGNMLFEKAQIEILIDIRDALIGIGNLLAKKHD